MKRCMVTANPYEGFVRSDYENPRTEYAWAYYLKARLVPFNKFQDVKGYDQVFVILPKQNVVRDTDGRKFRNSQSDLSSFLPALEYLKHENGHIILIQEGPVSYWQNYGIKDQAAYLHAMSLFDMFLAHDEKSALWFRGILQEPGIPVEVIPSVMIWDNRPEPIPYSERQGTLIGGNFAEWHGGANSYLVAKVFEEENFIPVMHTFDPEEQHIQDLKHLDEMLPLTKWLEMFRKKKYAVHMMPVVGAGSFSLNAVYSGVPCIGNRHIPTQADLFPTLSFDPNDLYHAKLFANELLDREYWEDCVNRSYELFLESKYEPSNWKVYMNNILSE